MANNRYFNNGTEAIKNYLYYNGYNQASNMIHKYIVNRYGFSGSIYLYKDSEIESAFKNWVNKFKKYNFKDISNREQSTINFKLDDRTWFVGIFTNANTLRIEQLFSNTITNYNNGNGNSNNEYKLVYYIFGKKSKKYYKEFNNMVDSIKDQLYIFNVSGNSNTKDDDSSEFNVTMNKLICRNLDTLFFDDNVKDIITNHIDKFDANTDIYKNRNLLYKTGILLYGNPGTGKTSLANAIASYCNCSLVVVNMSTFATLDVAEFTATLNADDKRYVILLEDIDTIFNSLDRKSEDINDKEKAIINKLLQFLDSNTSPSNVIFIATTNYYERLDEAIKRPGRFDLKVEIKPIVHESTLVKMCKSFDLSDEDISDIVESNKLPIKQSDLQAEILRRIK